MWAVVAWKVRQTWRWMLGWKNQQIDQTWRMIQRPSNCPNVARHHKYEAHLRQHSRWENCWKRDPRDNRKAHAKRRISRRVIAAIHTIAAHQKYCSTQIWVRQSKSITNWLLWAATGYFQHQFAGRAKQWEHHLREFSVYLLLNVDAVCYAVLIPHRYCILQPVESSLCHSFLYEPE